MSRKTPAAFVSLVTASLLLALAVSEAHASETNARARTDAPIAFDIPAQSLAAALIAYGAATGLEIFYDADLADRRKSAGAIGTLTPAAALQDLLDGTGYVAQSMGSGAITIVSAPDESAAANAAADAARQGYEPYFALVQARVRDFLCQASDLSFDRRDSLLRLWLNPAGTVAQAEMLDGGGKLAAEQATGAAMRGLAIGAPPPGMPQPLTMVIFELSRTSKECRLANGRRRAG